MLLVLITNFFLLTFISSINSQCTQSKCNSSESGSTCCFGIGCCPAGNNVCCPNDPKNCCSSQYPVCCGAGKGCCPRQYQVCCSSFCCSSGSYCCGQKCCRRDALTRRLIQVNNGVPKINQYQKIMMSIYNP